MWKAIGVIAVGLGLVMCAQTAWAADVSIDFMQGGDIPTSLVSGATAIGAVPGSQDWNQTTHGTPIVVTKDTVTVSLTATDTADSTAFAYLDVSPAYGGAGVVGNGGSTPGGSDDGIQAGETLKLTFDGKVTIKNFTAWDNGDSNTPTADDHNNVVDYDGDDKFELSIDGGAFFDVSLTDLDANASKDVNWVGTTFEIRHVNADFYWSAMTVDPVPEPGTLLLIGSGIAGIFAVRRRRTA